MKHVFLYKLKVINIIICTKDIINKYILKKIKIKSNNQEIEGNNWLFIQKVNNVKCMFLINDKISFNNNWVQLW